MKRKRKRRLEAPATLARRVPSLADSDPVKGNRCEHRNIPFSRRDASLGSEPRGAVDIEERSIPGGLTGVVSVRIVRPKGASETLPAIIFRHGGGWTHREIRSDERLVAEIANAAHAAVIFVDDRRTKASHPIVVEKSYVAAKFVAEYRSELNVDSSRIGIAGDSVGGDLTAALALLAKQRGFPTFRYQVLFTPVCDASPYRRRSYKRIASGPWVVRTIFDADTRGVRTGLFMGARGRIVRLNAA